jgi:hypothetical protein
LKSQVNFPPDLVEAINNFVSPLTGGLVSVESGNISVQDEVKNCCTEESGPMDMGEETAQGTGQLGLAINGLPLGPALPKIVYNGETVLGPVQILVDIGFKWGVDLNFNGNLGLKTNQCEPSDGCAFASVSVSAEPTVFGVAEAIACESLFNTKQKCVGVGAKGSASIALSGGFRYNSPESCTLGLQAYATIESPTFAITAQIDLPAAYEFSWQWKPQIPGLPYTCSYPGGCGVGP